jgi:vacuolar-type H+-ATPase subunit F/Vma7
VKRVAAIGERAVLEGFALAGVELVGSDDESSWVDEFDRLPDDVGLLLLTPASHEALAGALSRRGALLWTVVGG